MIDSFPVWFLAENDTDSHLVIPAFNEVCSVATKLFFCEFFSCVESSLCYDAGFS